jgi:phosphocarrier protein HPr
MVTFQAKVMAESGLHARPAALLVNRANQFKSAVTLEKDTNKADAKSILGVMTLGAKAGDEITVHVSGEDEEAAASAIKELFEKNFEL